MAYINNTVRHRLHQLLGVMGAVIMSWSLVFADTEEDLRISIGVKLFPSMLAADQHITKKQSDNGLLKLLVLYRNKSDDAEVVAKKIQATSTVRGIPIQTKILSVEELSTAAPEPMGGIFLAENLHNELPIAITYAQNSKVILFSPFTGDVEQGVQCGISVRDRILPYLNLRALHSADIQLKEFFLKVAEQYE